MSTYNSTNANGGYIELRSSGTVYGDIGTAAQLVTSGSASDFCLNGRGSRGLVLGTNNTSRLYIDSSGNVGIGTTSAVQKVHIAGSGQQAVKIQDTGNTNGLDVGNNTTESFISTADNKPITFYTNNSERAKIDGSGRLLVGTSSAFDTANTGTSWLVGIEKPSGYSALSIKTNEASSNGAYLNLGKSRGATANSKTIVNDNDELGGIYFEGADGASMRVGARVAAFVDGTPGASDLPTRLVFSTTADGASSPTERMRISNDGNVNVGGGGVTARVAAASTATSTAVLYGYANTASYTSTVIQAQSETSAGTGWNLYIGYASAGNLVYRVYGNGNVQNANNSYAGTSDIKLKENIVDANSQWDDLKALQVRKYNFKKGQTHTQIGLIAQEVELVSPGLVSESPDRDEEGNDLGTTTKSVNYSVLYMKAVKALQEAMERIEALEAKVAALEGV
jgi:hypothetical protein